ncbi:MAG: hypothetical protein ACQERN_04830 [Thermodesulfobacteriota bacterium]
MILGWGLLLCGIWASSVSAQKMIVLPPNVDYLTQCKSTDQHEALLSGLGRNIYFNMKSSIEKFNSLKKSQKKQLRYKALDIVSACCQDNRKIEKFYDDVKPESEKLENVCEKHQSNVIVWAEFEPRFKKKLVEAMNEQTDCYIGIRLSVYENGGQIRSKALALKYKYDFNAFSGKAQADVSEAIISLLKEIHFEKHDDPDSNDNSDTVQQAMPGIL